MGSQQTSIALQSCSWPRAMVQKVTPGACLLTAFPVEANATFKESTALTCQREGWALYFRN